MPQVIPFVVGVVKALAATFVGRVVLAIAANVILGAISRALMPKTPRARLGPQEVSIRGSIEPMVIVYGERKVFGKFVSPPLTSGATNEFLWYVLVLAGHEIESMTDVWIDDIKIRDIDIDGAGDVTGGKFATKMRIKRHLGSPTQAADSDLIGFTEWTAAHQFKGRAYIVVRMERDDNIYTNGAPQNIAALIKGKKLYDPRLDGTKPGGSGAHRDNDSTTWEYTNTGQDIGRNPALVARDILAGRRVAADPTTSHGLGEDDTRIDDSLCQTSADVCEELPSIPGPSTQDRYTCDVVFESPASVGQFNDIIDTVKATMLGQIVYVDGLYRIIAGEFNAPTITITEKDFSDLAPLRRASKLAEGDLYNYVRGTYYDPAREHKQVEFSPRANSTFETEDKERIPREIELRGLDNEFRAERIAMLLLKQSRNQVRATLPLRPSALRLNVWDTVNVTHADLGWSSKVFRIQRMSFDPSGAILAEVAEETSASWDDPAVGEYGTQPTGTSPPTVDDIPVAPTNLLQTAIVDGVELEWNNQNQIDFEFVEVVWSPVNDRNDGAAAIVGRPAGDTFVHATRVLSYYWVRKVNKNGAVSAYVPASATAGISAVPLSLEFLIADGFIDRSDASGAYWDVDNSGGSAGNASLSFTGGLVNGRMIMNRTSTGAGLSRFSLVARAENRIPQNTIYALLVRLRRTTAITGTDGIKIGLGVQNLSGTATSIKHTDTYLGGANWTINEWQEVTIAGRLVPESDSGGGGGAGGKGSKPSPPGDTDKPYLYVEIDAAAQWSGTYEIDAVVINTTPLEFEGDGKPGLVPDPGSITGKVLSDDGTFVTLPADPQSDGSFTGTLTGYASNPSGTVFWSKTGNKVTLWITAAINGTSNSVSMTMTGIPAAIQPTVIKNTGHPCWVTNNNVSLLGYARFISASVISFALFQSHAGAGVSLGGAAFQSSGTKGIPTLFGYTYDLT